MGLSYTSYPSKQLAEEAWEAMCNAQLKFLIKEHGLDKVRIKGTDRKWEFYLDGQYTRSAWYEYSRKERSWQVCDR